MTNKIIQQIEAEQMNKEIPAFAPGDTVIVQVKVKALFRPRLRLAMTTPSKACRR